ITRSYERNILHQMNRTAVKGETFILHCNGTPTGAHKDIGWRKDGTFIFNYSPVINQTETNYTSSRMQVDPRNPRKLQISDVQLSDAGLYSCFPLDMQWRLTIEESEKPTLILWCIVPSVTGAVMIFVIIFCVVAIHRKCKKKEGSDHIVDEH
ncbi:roundabout 2-like isoform X2, partial [Clarias magur]